METIISDALNSGTFNSKLLPDILNNAYHGIAIVGLDGKWLLVNKSLCNMLGYTEDELLNLSFQEITHKDDLSLDLRKLNRLLKNEISSYKMQKRYFTKTGNISLTK